MKNIEKIAIDSILEQFSSKYKEMIEHSISAKAAAEAAQQNFKKAVSPVLGAAKDFSTMLLADEVSEEAMQYFDQKVSEIIKFTFTSNKK